MTFAQMKKHKVRKAVEQNTTTNVTDVTMQLELADDGLQQKSTRNESSHKMSSMIEDTQMAPTQLNVDKQDNQISMLSRRNLNAIEDLDKLRQETHLKQKKELKEKKLEEKFKVNKNKCHLKIHLDMRQIAERLVT